VAAANIQRLDFIKMDVEGFERFVIEGGQTTFRKFEPVLVTEFNKNALTIYSEVSPESYYQVLTNIYPYLYDISQIGKLKRVDNFAQLSNLLAGQRFWADLLCARSAINRTNVFSLSEQLLHRANKLLKRLR
jgi:hypothetical protein